MLDYPVDRKKFYKVCKGDFSQLTQEELVKCLKYCDEMIGDCHKKARKGWVYLKHEIEDKVPIEMLTENDMETNLSDVESSYVERKTAKDKSRIMYIEYKGDGLAGTAWIGRVHFSKSGKSIYYGKQVFKSLKGDGCKANYYDVDTGEGYWISGCKKKGDDTLYPGIIEIDEDVRQEYWNEIRNMPDNVHLKSFRSEGKYSKRKPK